MLLHVFLFLRYFVTVMQANARFPYAACAVVKEEYRIDDRVQCTILNITVIQLSMKAKAFDKT